MMSLLYKELKCVRCNTDTREKYMRKIFNSRHDIFLLYEYALYSTPSIIAAFMIYILNMTTLLELGVYDI